MLIDVSLFWDEIIHLLIATGLAGYIYWRYRKWSLVIIVYATGFLIDIDHLIDFWIDIGWSADLALFFKADYFQESNRLFLIFHTPEILIPTWLVAWYYRRFDVAWAVTLGLMGHLAYDVVSNDVYWHTYFLASRLYHRFDLKSLML